MTGPPGPREPSAPPAGTAPRGAGGPGANGAVPPRQGAVPPRPGAGAPWYEDTPPRPRQAPAWPGEVPPPPEAAQPGPAGPQPAGSQPADPQSADPAQGPRPDQWVPGSAPPAYGAGAAGPPGRAATGAGPVGWLGAARPPDAAKRPDADSTQEEPPSVRWPSRQADPGRAPGPPGWLPDWPSSPPAQDSLEAAHDRPEAAHDRPEATQDQPAATHDRPASENDDFWDRVNEELGGDAGLEQRTPPRAPPVGGDRWSTPSGRQADEAAEAGSGAGSSTARDLWSPWPPRAVSRPGPPLAEGEDRPRDRADAEAQVAEDAATRTAEPAPARRDAAADRPGAAGAGKEAGIEEQEPEGGEPEGEEAAPSPWSIPLTLVGDLKDFDEDDDGQPASQDSLTGDSGTATAPAAGTRPAQDRPDSGAWSSPSRVGDVEKIQKAPAGPKADGASGPGEPGKADQARTGARLSWASEEGTAGLVGRDKLTDGAAATRAGEDAGAKASPEDSGTGSDADAKADRAGSSAGDDRTATQAVDDAGADGATSASRADGDADALAIRAGGSTGSRTEGDADPGRDALSGAAAADPVRSSAPAARQAPQAGADQAFRAGAGETPGAQACLVV